MEDTKLRKYMRDYKRKKYAENPDNIKLKNTAFYYKRTLGMSLEEVKELEKVFGQHFSLAVKIKKHLDAMKEEKPALVGEILKPYLGELEN